MTGYLYRLILEKDIERAKAYLIDASPIEKSRKVNESQIDFLDSCPFCGGEVELRDKFDGTDETSFFHCTKCHMWFEKFVWRGYGHAHIIEEWNRRVKE